MALDSAADIKASALRRAYEPADGTSDWDADADNALIEVWRDLWMRHPWVDLVKDPPGAFVTTDDITNRTLTIAATGTSAAATLSSSISSSVAGYKIKPSGKNWYARITAHTAATAALTLDAAPETIAAGTACVIFQDEYDLASDLGLFVDGLWDQNGDFVRLVSEEELKTMYPGAPPAGRPDVFCRLTRRKIRLSHYPTSVRRYEYPYTAEPTDPSGSGTLSIGAHLRPVYARGVLAEILDMKIDRRTEKEKAEYERAIERAVIYETRRRTGLGQLSRQPSGNPRYSN